MLMGELETALIYWYGLKADRIEPYMDGYMIYAGRTEKYIRKNLFSTGRILFIHGAKEHLAKKGFENIDRFIPTLSGEPYVRINDVVYTLSERFKGKECDFYDMDALLDAMRTIARMHVASKGYMSACGSFARSSLGDLPKIYEKKLLELKKLKNCARRGKTVFDGIYGQVADKFCIEGEKALERIKGATYDRLVRKTLRDKAFCHGNLSHKNIIFGEKGIHIRGFEYCRHDVRVSDIVDFIRRRLKKCSWSLDDATLLVSEYARIDRPGKDELEVIKAMLQFPYRFWELSNRFYNSRRSWAERTYTPKLIELAGSFEKMKSFNAHLDNVLG